MYPPQKIVFALLHNYIFPVPPAQFCFIFSYSNTATANTTTTTCTTILFSPPPPPPPPQLYCLHNLHPLQQWNCGGGGGGGGGGERSGEGGDKTELWRRRHYTAQFSC